jgi:signal transduction histidine kinase
MTRRLLLSYLTITAFVLLVLEIPLGVAYTRAEDDRLTRDVERDARVLATLVEDVLEGTSHRDLSTIVVPYERRTGGRVVVVDVNGISVADSSNPTGPRRNFSTRPEIARALTGSEASGKRHSDTLGKNILFVAVPVASGGEVHGAVRISVPTAKIDRRVRRYWIGLSGLAAVVLAAVAAVGALLAGSVTRPLRALDGQTRLLAAGDLAVRARTDAGPPEVRDLARQFNEMAARLEELVQAQQQFVADASHELRTPLTALMLRLENIENASPPDLAADTAAASAEVARLARLVEGLLALARAEGQRPAREVVDLAAVAAERVAAWGPLAQEQGVAVRLLPSTAHRARVVPGATEQILDNLLANALEVAPTGSAITVAVAPTNGRDAELHVVDHGPGMSADERARAFDRFWRAPGAAGRGSGLGLAIVAQLAAASGGEARLEAAPGGGVDAVVRLEGV